MNNIDPSNLKANSGERVKDAFEFAQRLADRELASIDRLHKRTLISLSVITASFLAIITVLGWFGFDHLSNLAISKASESMQAEVKEQVREKLTTDNVTSIVRKEVDTFSGDELRRLIRDQLSADPLHAAIVQAAREEAQKQVEIGLAPRHFTQQQSKVFIGKIDGVVELEGYSYCTNYNPLELGSAQFGKEVALNLSRTKMRTAECPWVYEEMGAGITIYYDKRDSAKPARRVWEAFRAVGQDVRIAPTVFGPPPSSGQAPAKLLIFVGPGKS